MSEAPRQPFLKESFFAFAALAVCLVACGPTSPIAGTYAFTSDAAKKEDLKEYEQISMVIRNDGSYTFTVGNFVAEGSTKIEGDIVTFSPVTFNGVPAEEAKQKLLATAKGKPNEAVAVSFFTDLTSDDRMRISENGKRLTSIDPEDTKTGVTHFVRK